MEKAFLLDDEGTQEYRQIQGPVQPKSTLSLETGKGTVWKFNHPRRGGTIFGRYASAMEVLTHGFAEVEAVQTGKLITIGKTQENPRPIVLCDEQGNLILSGTKTKAPSDALPSASETPNASDVTTVRDETMPLRTLPNGQKIWHFPLKATGKMTYGTEATTKEALKYAFSTKILTPVGKHETTGAFIYLCDAEGNFILKDLEEY
ncbi:MAG: hypothetical protein UT33_C0007G0076 [Candidatus Peregrinibacteria bacterium GW2011_GWC2_39_14]|nr:MAG: hypothetical protein US92_C0002G0077 [Candidatus Peregrinibacteria bacterium GW2011_GWA2_38_36]KKR06888.1 MAG: hypothetical protein UT33_C0007G0076 [Candidatus Peregrinibacteria bacterium GW2011_GWC2_39_14]